MPVRVYYADNFPKESRRKSSRSKVEDSKVKGIRGAYF